MFKQHYALRSALVTAVAGALLLSCSTDSQMEELDQNEIMMSKFTELGFDASDMKSINKKNPITGESERGYLLERDIFIPQIQVDEMLGSPMRWEGPMGEQYRTSNLVSTPRTIRVLGYTGGSNALDNTMRTALSWAVDNYNALNTNLNFTLAYGTSTGSYDIVVYRVSGSGGGSAGFPSGGAPYKWVQIQSGTSSYGTNVVEHVITHEIGHSLGLRHTDYFNRSLSCGSGGNEGSGGVGAIHIPGTPTGFDANSIMLACFSANEDGEFGYYDRVALEYLY